MAQLRVSAWAIKNPIPISLLFIAMILVGTFAYNSLAIKQFPNIEFPAVAVTVTQAGAAPTEMESQITRPIEDAIAGLSDIDQLSSVVTPGVSTTMVQFKIGYDTQKAADEVQSKVDQARANLPREIDPPIIQRIEITAQSILTYAVADQNMSTEELSWFIDNTVARQLQSLPGVAQITRFGGVNREVNVTLDPVRMAAMGVTAPQINAALAQVSADVPGGSVSIGGRNQSLRVLGAAVTVDQVRNLIVPVAGRNVKLSDVAQVGDGAGEPGAYALLNGRPVVGFDVQKTKEASDVKVEAEIDAKLEELFKGRPMTFMEKMSAPKDSKTGKKPSPKEGLDRDTGSTTPNWIQPLYPTVTTEKVVNRVFETKNSYHATLSTMFEGMILASLVVFLFLRDWRATVVTTLAMPASLIPTFAIMALMGFSLNIITLLALTLVIGILVDDAIVEIENIEKRVHRGMRPYEAALEGADQIGLAVVATTFAIFVVFAPVSFMPGIPGQFFKEFGLTVCVAVLFSLVAARLLTPLLAAYFLKPKHAAPVKPLPKYYENTLNWSLAHPWLTCVIGGLAFFGAIGLAVGFKLPIGLTPESNPDFYQVNVEGAPGSTLQDSDRAAKQIASIVSKRPETSGTFVQVGVGALDPSGNSQSGPSGANRALITVLLKPAKERKTIIELREELLPLVSEVPDVRVSFASGGFGGGGAQVILTSETGEGLDQAALTLQRQMRTLPFLIDPRATNPPTAPEVVIRPKWDEAARLGVTAQSIAQVVRVSTSGDINANVAKLTVGERRVPIKVRLPKESRTDLATLRSLQVPTASGGLTTLESVADIQFQAGPSQLDRFGRKRQVTVNAALSQGAAQGDAQTAVDNLPIMKNLPPGVSKAVAGEQQAMQQLFGGFIIAIFSGIFLVYGVMVLLFGSFFKPVTILSALPLALGGAVVALLIMRLALDMPALIGFLMLMGLAAKNSILLVEYAIEREREGVGRREAILEACHERARPIIMTTLAMMAGMLPTALGIGAGSEFRQPMAVAVIGGLITSTVLSLVIVPTIYEIVDKFEEWLRPKLAKLITPKDAPAEVHPAE